jgi:hypothetical protein
MRELQDIELVLTSCVDDSAIHISMLCININSKYRQLSKQLYHRQSLNKKREKLDGRTSRYRINA